MIETVKKTKTQIIIDEVEKSGLQSGNMDMTTSLKDFNKINEQMLLINQLQLFRLVCTIFLIAYGLGMFMFIFAQLEDTWPETELENFMDAYELKEISNF